MNWNTKTENMCIECSINAIKCDQLGASECVYVFVAQFHLLLLLIINNIWWKIPYWAQSHIRPKTQYSCCSNQMNGKTERERDKKNVFINKVSVSVNLCSVCSNRDWRMFWHTTASNVLVASTTEKEIDKEWRYSDDENKGKTMLENSKVNVSFFQFQLVWWVLRIRF